MYNMLFVGGEPTFRSSVQHTLPGTHISENYLSYHSELQSWEHTQTKKHQRHPSGYYFRISTSLPTILLDFSYHLMIFKDHKIYFGKP